MPLRSAVILFSLCLSTPVWARKVESWPYERLMKEADLVVIAHAVSSTPCPDTWSENLFRNVAFQGVQTTFKVSARLKGTCPATVKILHFRLEQDVLLNDGPSLVTFLTKPMMLDVRDARKNGGGLQQRQPVRQSLVSPPEYLLYLRLRKDGRYEALSGQVDPAFSVRALFQQSGLQSGLQSGF